jgi:hypothetical protein
MTGFIINTPNHKRWWLPDRKHQVNSVIMGDRIHLSVIEPLSNQSLESISFHLDDENTWKDHCALFQQLAEKKYADRNVQYIGNRQRGGSW